jgi:hypothetical protein
MNPNVHTMYSNITLEEKDSIEHIQQAKKYVAQILQKVANGKRFEGPSNGHLSIMNGFIDRSRSRCRELYQVIEARSSLMKNNPATPPLKDDEAAHLYDDEIIDDFYKSLVEIHGVLHGVLHGQLTSVTRMDSDSIASFPDRARREAGYDPRSSMSDLDIVLSSLGAPSAASKTRGYGGEPSVSKK